MTFSACTRLRPLAKLRKLCAIVCRTAHSSAPSPHETPDRLPGITARGVVDCPSQKSVSPATEVIMGMEADGVEAATQQIAHAACPSCGSGGGLGRVLPLQLLIGVAEQVRGQIELCGHVGAGRRCTSVPTFATKAAAPLSIS